MIGFGLMATTVEVLLAKRVVCRVSALRKLGPRVLDMQRRLDELCEEK